MFGTNIMIIFAISKFNLCKNMENNNLFKELIALFKKGGGIHINPKNKGKFTASAKRAGMGVQEFARHVLANKDKYSTTQIRRAVFAKNSKKFKHKSGGMINNPYKLVKTIDITNL